jgi:uncharacterized protein (DUF1697 family)
VTVHIALLRGVNVGGYKKVGMADLRALAAQLGFENAKTLLQSGNLVFHSRHRTAAIIEQLLERETSARLHLDTAFFVRDGEEWTRILSANPFPAEARRDPAHLLVVFLKRRAAAHAVKALQAAITGPETVSAAGRELYAVYPAGIGRSRLTLPLIERTLDTRGTGRNWNTVLKLAQLAGV